MRSLKIVYLLSVAFVASIIFATVPKERSQTELTHSITPSSQVVITTQIEETQVTQPKQNVTVPTLPVFTFEPLESKFPSNPQQNTFMASIGIFRVSLRIT